MGDANLRCGPVPAGIFRIGPEYQHGNKSHKRQRANVLKSRSVKLRLSTRQFIFQRRLKPFILHTVILQPLSPAAWQRVEHLTLTIRPVSITMECLYSMITVFFNLGVRKPDSGKIQNQENRGEIMAFPIFLNPDLHLSAFLWFTCNPQSERDTLSYLGLGLLRSRPDIER